MAHSFRPVMAAAGGSSSASIPPGKRESVGTGSTAVSEHPARHRMHRPKTLPSWIDSYEVRYGNPTEQQLQLLSRPTRPVLPQHNGTPNELQRRVSRDGFIDWSTDGVGPELIRAKTKLPLILRGKGGAERGRRWDHLRSAEPVIVPGRVVLDSHAQWQAWLKSSAYGHIPHEEAELIDPEMLDKMQPGFNSPVDMHSHSLDNKRARTGRTATLYKRLWLLMLRHPLVPLALRLTVLFTSIIALALSAHIFQIEKDSHLSNSEISQSLVAIVVDSVAVPYIGYMTKDEYTGKPLGLRPATQKIALILMDLFFIIFKSASTALAFEALVYHTNNSPTIALAKGLAAFMLIGLISWSLTLTVNVFRLVVRLSGGEDDGRM